MRMEKENYLQVYLEEYKYKVKKTKTIKFIEAQQEPQSGSGLEFDTKLEAKIKS